MPRVQPNRFRPSLAALENRECPAVNCVAVGSTLVVTGDTGDNAIAITVPSAGAVTVVGDGVTFNFQNIQSIRVATGDGADRVSVEIVEPSTPAAAFGIAVNADLGGGNDAFSVQLRSSAAPYFGSVASSAVVDVRVNGSSGDDQLIGFVGGNTPATLVPAVRLAFDGSFGNDTVSLGMKNTILRKQMDAALTGGDGADTLLQTFYTNNVMAPLNLTLSGGGGDDVIDSKFDVDGPRSVYNAPVVVQGSGGAGNDRMRFRLGGWEGTTPPTGDGHSTDPVVNSRFGVFLDGGDGNDDVTARAKVAPQGAGSLTVQLFGRAGDDRLALDLDGVPPSIPSSGLIDGGDGYDTDVYSSPSVVVQNCEA